jgi:hypothetical protein
MTHYDDRVFKNVKKHEFALRSAALDVMRQTTEDQLGQRRTVNLPGLSVTAQQMVDALGASLGAAYVKKVEWRFEQRIQNIVGTWPQAWDAARARSLGMVGDESLEQVILSYATNGDESGQPFGRGLQQALTNLQLP